MATITINTSEAVFESRMKDKNGDWQTITTDYRKMHPTYVAAYLRKAAQRFLNDAYSQEQPDNKYAMAIEENLLVHSGEAMPEKVRRGSGISTKHDPITTLALKRAKDFLTNTFKEKTDATKAVDFAADDRFAKFFKVKDDRATWIDSAVIEWMEQDVVKENVKDFMKAAAKELDKASADLSGLGL